LPADTEINAKSADRRKVALRTAGCGLEYASKVIDRTDNEAHGTKASTLEDPNLRAGLGCGGRSGCQREQCGSKCKTNLESKHHPLTSSGPAPRRAIVH
jgi:hypothetical protein